MLLFLCKENTINILRQKNYLNKVVPALKSLISELDELTELSLLPEKNDSNFWDVWLYNVIWKEVCLLKLYV